MNTNKLIRVGKALVLKFDPDIKRKIARDDIIRSQEKRIRNLEKLIKE